MNLGRCPICHSRLHLDALVQDEAGRELLALLAGLDDATGRALILYLGLFRPATRDLSNERALRLAKSALELGAGHAPGVLAQAMSDATEALRRKDAEPLTDHAYLNKVVKSCAARAVAPPTVAAPQDPRPAQTQAPSKTLGAIAKLQNMKRHET